MKFRPVFISAVLLSLSLQPYAAAKFPFPQNTTYPFGIKPTNIDNSKIQAVFNDFVKRFYEENNDKARIKWDTPSQTVSEGIGYGMLVMVYMDNASNNTQGKFDKLWNYYTAFPDEFGLMNWKIDGFNGAAERNAATDAELDVAMALVQAYKQWNDQKYLDNATGLVNKIYQNEVNENGYLKPGDAWDSKKNPSYLSTAALESFKHAGSQDWNRVITNSYTLLKACRNNSTGLVPDWCSENGSAQGSFSYDAARTPWRIAWDYVWYGRSDAKDFCSKIASWIAQSTGTDASKVVDGYGLDGNKSGQWNNSTFVGPFACAGMVDATHQAWLNSGNSQMNTLADNGETYYHECLKLITMLLLSGNMPDLWNTTTVQKYTLTVNPNPSGGGTVQINPSGTQYNSGSQITLQAQPSGNYRFVNWSGDISGTEISKSVTITQNMNITANFEVANGVSNGTEALHSLSLSVQKDIVTWSVPSSGNVSIRIFDVTGKMISEPVSRCVSRGISSVRFSQPLNEGLYIIHMNATSGQMTRQLLVTR